MEDDPDPLISMLTTFDVTIDPTLMTILIVSIVVLIVLSGFFSACETAFTSANEARLKNIATKKKRAKYILSLYNKYDQTISTLLIGNNLVNIGASSLGVTLFVGLVGSGIGEMVSTIVLTVVVLIFGEITPKMIAKRMPEKYLMFFAYPILVIYYIFWPFAKIFDGWKWLLTKIFRFDKKKQTLTEEEFKIVVSDIKDEGVINQVEHDLIKNSLHFDDVLVEKCMTPFANMVFLTNAMSNDEMRTAFENNNYSRVPYIDRDSGQVLGILLQRDFYEMFLKGEDDISSILVPAMFVKNTAKVSSLFNRMKKSRNMMAVVLNDERHLIGIITMEDLLEELVGEIEDEQDDEDEEEGMLDDKPILTSGMAEGNVKKQIKSNVQSDSLEYSDEELEGEEDLNEEVDELEDKYE